MDSNRISSIFLNSFSRVFHFSFREFLSVFASFSIISVSLTGVGDLGFSFHVQG